eukprot:768387-Hanusia_phi.AAC.3
MVSRCVQNMHMMMKCIRLMTMHSWTILWCLSPLMLLLISPYIIKALVTTLRDGNEDARQKVLLFARCPSSQPENRQQHPLATWHGEIHPTDREWPTPKVGDNLMKARYDGTAL